MSSSGTWTVLLRKRAQKGVARAPRPDQERLRAAIKEMESDPFAGDVVRLTGEHIAFRRRVGDWRLLFDVHREVRLVEIRSIERRSTTTYRRR
jgi:mRNA-degrading endonuclease RelE of RelBE toxin-antitoxin system